MDREQLNAGGVESRALTGLRGLAAVLVMSHHLLLQIGLDEHLPMLRPMLRKGYLGVDLFFVLSGFVLSMTYGAWFDGRQVRRRGDYMRFLSRRVARLWPLHVMVLAFLVLQHVTISYTSVTPLRLLANILMVQAWGFSAELNPPAWSVSTEFLAYLLFPFLALLALKGRRRPWVCLALIAAALMACMYLAPPLGPARRGRLDIYFNYSLLPGLRCLAGFMMGMLAWRVGQAEWLRRMVQVGWVGPVAALLLLVLMMGRVNDMLLYPLFPIIVLGMHYGTGPVQRALSVNPLHRIGVLSYAIYLIHFTLLVTFPFGDMPLRYTLSAYLVATLVLAEAAHRLVEVPGRAVLRALGERVLGLAGAVFGWPPAPMLKPPLRGPGG